MLVINAIESRHEKVPCDNIYSCITKIVDKISASIPGWRYISNEEHIQKINTIEEICNSFDGVKNSYVIKTGKQVRVIINPKSISDENATTAISPMNLTDNSATPTGPDGEDGNGGTSISFPEETAALPLATTTANLQTAIPEINTSE